MPVVTKAFSTSGEDRKLLMVSRLCWRTVVAATAALCKSAGLTTWVCAQRPEDIPSRGIKTETVKPRANCRAPDSVIAPLLYTTLYDAWTRGKPICMH